MTGPGGDRAPAEGGDVGPAAASTSADDDLVTAEGVNETGADDSPGASVAGEYADPAGEDAEPNEPG